MNRQHRQTRLVLRVAAFLAVAFGLLTLKEGGLTLTGDATAVAAAGNSVLFVLWFNFLAGFAYIAAGAGLWLQRRWAAWLAITIAATTALVFVALGIYIASGGAFERRTVLAMSLRLAVWVALAVLAWRRLLRVSKLPRASSPADCRQARPTSSRSKS